MSEWQPIETAPKDMAILVNCRSAQGVKIVHWIMDERYEAGGVWGLTDHRLQVAYKPTHWMPLLEAPR